MPAIPGPLLPLIKVRRVTLSPGEPMKVSIDFAAVLPETEGSDVLVLFDGFIKEYNVLVVQNTSQGL